MFPESILLHIYNVPRRSYYSTKAIKKDHTQRKTVTLIFLYRNNRGKRWMIFYWEKCINNLINPMNIQGEKYDQSSMFIFTL